ncbi:MAG: hypothetical protein FDZ75_01710, partial [Actinobacteria bacterium]
MRLAIATVLLTLLVLSGCARPVEQQAPVLRPSAGIENAQSRAAMQEHAQAVWPQARTGLSDPSARENVLDPVVAARSHLGTPTVVWRYDSSIRAADAWGRLAAAPDRREYVIPVLDGAVVVDSLWA